MIDKNRIALLKGEIFEEDEQLTLIELCQACDITIERVMEIIDEGIVEPKGENAENWSFRGVSLHRVRFVLSMERDLGINTAGSALALELLAELERLRKRLERLGDANE
jgi:chaperone modulatory protein CbpM